MAHELQGRIQNLLDALTEAGKERGAQVAIYQNGRLIVNAWAGIADVRNGRRVDSNTLFPVFSTTKGIMATVIHLLAERGQLEYDRPIAHYWPEFAANGKEGITLRHALAHTSGLPNMPAGLTPARVCDWEYMCRAVAKLKPLWPVGDRFSYHPVTYGWLLGEVARRVDGRALQPFLEAEVTGPLGISTMFVGVPADLEPTVAFLEEDPDPPVPPAPEDWVEEPVTWCMQPLTHWMNRSDARQAGLPGSNGIMSALAIARHYAALLPGGLDGIELLPPERVRVATTPQVVNGPSEQKTELNHALGYGLDQEGFKGAFGHAGHGGSAGYAIPSHGVAVGVARNRFHQGNLASNVAGEIRKVLGIS
jgi:CubicO group peptidase (beta-lactamase class C family)